jgi:hypothetical protein
MTPPDGDAFIAQIATCLSYDVAGTQNALRVEVNPANYKTMYPAGGPQLGAEAPSGPSVRLAMGGYPLINMTNTER